MTLVPILLADHYPKSLCICAHVDTADNVVHSFRPWGTDESLPIETNNDFLTPGVRAGIRFDTRRSVETTKSNLQLPFLDNPAAGYPTRGFLVEVEGRFAPPLLDVERSYGSIRGSVSGYLSFGEAERVTLGVRAGELGCYGREEIGDCRVFLTAKRQERRQSG